MKENLTNEQYWDGSYKERSGIDKLDFKGFRGFCARKIFLVKEKYLDSAKTVLELGGGGSSWLITLAQLFPDTQFSCLDYSEVGCKKLEIEVEKENIKNLEVIQGDFFKKSELHGKFDFAYSHGVVEHFKDLGGVLLAHSEFLSESGVMVTIIPNMSGMLGKLTKAYNKAVYDIYVPHDLSSFEKGHEEAGLRIVNSGYLCSTNFGVLSSCFSSKNENGYKKYLFLSRLTKVIWFFESKFFSLPSTPRFSPYIYVVSKKK